MYVSVLNFFSYTLDFFFFFFSSRRRHTRWTGDWSSDVCSSDLTATSYATPDTTNYRINYPSQTVTTDCTPSPTGSHYLTGSQTAYDCGAVGATPDRKSTRLNSSHPSISYAVFCLKKKKKTIPQS